jgi:hypothetical protein
LSCCAAARAKGSTADAGRVLRRRLCSNEIPLQRRRIPKHRADPDKPGGARWRTRAAQQNHRRRCKPSPQPPFHHRRRLATASASLPSPPQKTLATQKFAHTKAANLRAEFLEIWSDVLADQRTKSQTISGISPGAIPSFFQPPLKGRVTQVLALDYMRTGTALSITNILAYCRELHQHHQVISNNNTTRYFAAHGSTVGRGAAGRFTNVRKPNRRVVFVLQNGQTRISTRAQHQTARPHPC